VSIRVIKRDINRAKFKVKSKIKVIINIRAEIRKASIKVIIKVNVRAISVFSIDRITKAKRNINIKAKIKK